MIQPATLAFLRQLKDNNDKAWFDARRSEYEAAKADFEAFVADLLKQFAATETALAPQHARDCIYRIFRDVRFSKDKTPYKAHFSAFFSRGGRKWDGAGYYIHLEPGAIFAGGGLWMPQPALLKAVRQDIDYGLSEFEGIIKDKTFNKLFPKLSGEALQRPPQGYEADNPAIGYLKMKSWTTAHAMKDAELTAKEAVKNVAGVLAKLKPLIDFLNRAAEGCDP